MRGRRERNVVIRPDSPTIISYSLRQGITPCRADKVIKDSWWVIAATEMRVGYRKQEVLLFLDSLEGHIPQESADEMVIHLMKRILFPWAVVKQLSEVYLVRHGNKGWQIPYGRVGGEGIQRLKR